MTYGGLQWYALKAYLEEAAGATERATSASAHPGATGPPFTITGRDWIARVRQEPPSRHGSIEIARLTLTIDGDADAVQRLIEFLHPRTMRGGG